MKRIDLKITFQCNNRCKFCVQGNKRQRCEDLSYEEIKKIFKKEKESYGEIVFTGGEPTIRTDIIELVAFAKKLGYRILIQTNGRMLAYKSFCKDIIKAGASVFAISIHGHNSKLHDGLTGVKGSFEQTVSGIENILYSGSLAVTNTVINKMNYRHLPEIANFLIGLRVPQYQFAFPHILGHALINKKDIVPLKKEIMPFVKKGLKIGLQRKSSPKTEAIPYCLLRELVNCASEWNTVETKTFDDKLILEDFNHWRKDEGKAKGPNCSKCKYFHSCEGPWREYPQLYGWKEFTPVK